MSNSTLSISADDVATFLSEHQDFFEGRDELLKSLSVPHESGGAISLLERQVHLLRKDNSELQEEMALMLEQAGDNDRLFEKTRSVVLALLKAPDLNTLAEILSEQMQEQFATDTSELLFICEDDHMLQTLPARTYSSAIGVLGALFEKKRTYCGALSAEQSRFFFAENPQSVASVAVVPVHLSLGDTEDRKGQRHFLLPILVLGSSKTDYFHNSQDTLFLDFIGEVLAELISKMMKNPA